ncbi:MAG: cysteine desulfurase NifS [Bacillota bacterium]
MKNIYMDYAATTPVKKEVVDSMLPFFTKHYGNASSMHQKGNEAERKLIASRKTVADFINSKPRELYFTSGGSESDNWAIKGIARANKGKHIITSKIEHHAVLHTCQALEDEGFEVTYLDVDKDGFISLKDLKEAIRPDTVLITIMFINNEIGTIEPIKEIGKIAHDNNVLFHTDAVQALGNIDIDVKKLNVDAMSFSAHKIYGPKGVGALYLKQGTKIKRLIEGGAQERKKRATTENIPGIVGFAKACELADNSLDEHIEKLSRLRDKLIEGVLENIEDVVVNGSRDKRHPGNANFAFKYIEGEAILLMLDSYGIQGSTGSACTTASLETSHVLSALGISHELSNGSLRLTVGDLTTEKDIDYVIKNLTTVVKKLRSMSPIGKNK